MPSVESKMNSLRSFVDFDDVSRVAVDPSYYFVDFDDVSRVAVDPSYYFVDCQLANRLAPNLRLADC